MAHEIERKFLVRADALPQLGVGTIMQQGYLTAAGPTVRVRIAGEQGYLTIKGPGMVARAEYEYAIPLADARDLLAMSVTDVVAKTRYRLPTPDPVLTWEIDVYSGANDGLIVAEVELPDEHYPVPMAPWCAAEVTDDLRFRNSNLARHPFSTWPTQGF